MSILLETTLGPLTIDLDVEGSPHLARNVLKLAKARYYTNVLVYNVQTGRFFQTGDPRGDGSGGAAVHGLIDAVRKARRAEGGGGDDGSSVDVTKSSRRFVRSEGRILSGDELTEKGRVVAVEMGGVKDTIGSQFLITAEGGPRGSGRALDGLASAGGGGAPSSAAADGKSTGYLSLGVVAEDPSDVLSKINGLYCDPDGRPFADVRVVRALVLDDPFDDPEGLDEVLRRRGVALEPEPADAAVPPAVVADDSDEEDGCGRRGIQPSSSAPRMASASPQWERPSEEIIEPRVPADVALAEEEEDGAEAAGQRAEEVRKKEDKSRAVVLEMLGDLPSADSKPPEDVLFVCKLNPITEDDDLELIFSRFDPNARAEIIRDPDTGDSLNYAFVEFSTKEQCSEAYIKMDNALVDDRRIRVDFSQSVAKVWNRYAQRKRGGGGHNVAMPKYGGVEFGGGRGFGGGLGRGGGRSGGRGYNSGRGRGPGRGGGRGGGGDRVGSRWQSRQSHADNSGGPRHMHGSTTDRNSHRDSGTRGSHPGGDDRSRSRSSSRDRRRSGRDDDGGRHRRTRSHSRSPNRSRSSSRDRGRGESRSSERRKKHRRDDRHRRRDHGHRRHRKHRDNDDRRHRLQHDDGHHRRQHRDHADGEDGDGRRGSGRDGEGRRRQRSDSHVGEGYDPDRGRDMRNRDSGDGERRRRNKSPSSDSRSREDVGRKSDGGRDRKSSRRRSREESDGEKGRKKRREKERSPPRRSPSGERGREQSPRRGR